jgi:hypothetical protein
MKTENERDRETKKGGGKEEVAQTMNFPREKEIDPTI